MVAPTTCGQQTKVRARTGMQSGSHGAATGQFCATRPVLRRRQRPEAPRSGSRQHWQWAMACRPERIARRLSVDFHAGDSMRISHGAIYQGLYVQVPRRIAARADRMPPRRPGITHAASLGPRERKILRCPRDHDQRVPCRDYRSRGARSLRGRDSSLESAVRPSAPWSGA
jgi:IS30 family transposase